MPFSLPSLIRSSSNFLSCGGSTTLGEDRPLSITRVPKKSDERAINIAPAIKAYSKGAKFSGFRCDTNEYVPTATKPANTNNENPAYMASMFWRFKPWPPCRSSPPPRSKAAANFPGMPVRAWRNSSAAPFSPFTVIANARLRPVAAASPRRWLASLSPAEPALTRPQITAVISAAEGRRLFSSSAATARAALA